MKKLLTGIIIALAAPLLFAQTTWTTNGVFSGKQAVSASLGMYSPGIIEQGQFPLSLRYRFEIPRVSAAGSFQFSEDTQDLVLNGIYFPLNTAHFRVGAGALYHAGWFQDTIEHELISFQSDIFLGAYATINFWRMYLNIHMGWFEQIITIPALPQEFGTFGQSDMAMSIFLGGKLLDNFSVELGISSYELYRYHLFFNPVFSISLRYQFQTPFFEGKTLEGRIFAELSNAVRYSDMFTLSGHVEYTATTISIGYTL
jgi:hypothetical protein